MVSVMKVRVYSDFHAVSPRTDEPAGPCADFIKILLRVMHQLKIIFSGHGCVGIMLSKGKQKPFPFQWHQALNHNPEGASAEKDFCVTSV
jgi:hypothetical protein